MSLPSLRDWIFSLKTFLAGMIALYVAFCFDLPRPYWALASVYIVSNPFVGATRSKALYRVLGTVLGAVASIALVPPFAETPYLLSAVIALWTSVFVYISISTRTARSYVFLLASYSVSIIALPALSDPLSIFDVAVARTEEITLGIVCASIVGSAIFPNRLAPTLVERTDAWFREATVYTKESLAGHIVGALVSGSRQKMAAGVRGFEFLLSQLAYDHASPAILSRSEELQGRMQLMLPVVSALADVLVAVQKSHIGIPSGIDELLRDIGRWIDVPLSENPEREAEIFRLRIAQLEPPPNELTTSQAILLSSALWRLRQLIDLWTDCRTLRLIIVHEQGNWRPRVRHWRPSTQRAFLDRGLALFSACSAGLVVFVSSSLWIASGWQDGAAAVSLGAIGACFFAALDEPVSMMITFFKCATVGVAISALYLFVVLPNSQDFPVLVIFFSFIFIPLGLLMPRPKWALISTLVALTTATFLGIDDAYDANILNFLNSHLAGLAGVIFASVMTGIIRPFGTDAAAARLTRSSWRDVVLSGSTLPLDQQRDLSARMLDRLVQLIPRLAPSEDYRSPSIEGLRDMGNALNMLDLRRLMGKLSGNLPFILNQVIDGVGAYYERCLESDKRQRVPSTLSIDIDSAIAQIMDNFASNPNGHGHTLGKRALLALTGLRLSLFPEPAQNGDAGLIAGE
ncbi:Inner membrane component of tripartite multidrug resistance system [Paraburkholderia caribensis MBA4]|uniref:Inner membrane component of tripartite multidrug resistance system n=1 Tax=Paraburkholderia caribensis MBA4 TaxID=1323664 RepID=A0A0P0RIF7_9BURK|nr:FUSC family protein [Paraburkholderia caribensis]ALL68428.1 Inner membrane component of tripartite multidrug resistance system [Paraburkholderia caribensis MBA4]